MSKPKIDPYQRGFDAYGAACEKDRRCPYPPKSKAAKRWQEGWATAQVQVEMADGAYDDGGVV